jgi:hypothetical protein
LYKTLWPLICIFSLWFYLHNSSLKEKDVCMYNCMYLCYFKLCILSLESVQIISLSWIRQNWGGGRGEGSNAFSPYSSPCYLMPLIPESPCLKKKKKGLCGIKIFSLPSCACSLTLGSVLWIAAAAGIYSPCYSWSSKTRKNDNSHSWCCRNQSFEKL